MVAQQLQELPEIGFIAVLHPGLRFGVFREIGLEQVADFVDRRGDQFADDVAGELQFGLLKLGVDQTDVIAERFALRAPQLDAGVVGQLQEQLQDAFGVQGEPSHEFGGEGQNTGFEAFVRRACMTQRGPNMNIVLRVIVFAHVERNGRFALGADPDDEASIRPRKVAIWSYSVRQQRQIFLDSLFLHLISAAEDIYNAADRYD